MATEWNKLQVLIGTVDYTSYLANQEVTATLPDGPEVGRATLTLLDSGGMGSITDWSSITLKGGGTAATVNLWAGYITRQQIEPFNYRGGSARLVTLDCQSAAVKLLTTEPITEQFGGGNLFSSIVDDIEVATSLVQNYATALYNAAKIGTVATRVDYIAFNNESLRSALNKLRERTGATFGVDAVPEFYYRQPSEGAYGAAYNYKLTDVEASWDTTNLPMTVKPVLDRDATSLRNSVRVIGGQTLSDVQSEDFTGDGLTTTFTVTYRPDVVISVLVDEVEKTVGVYFVDDPADFDVLVEFDKRTFHFNTEPANEADVIISYRYYTSVDVTVQDATSIAAIGTIWAPIIEDASISASSQGSALGSAYLASTGAVERATLTTRYGGTCGTVLPWEPGRLVEVTTAAFGWSAQSVRIRGVTMRAQGRPGSDGSCIIIWDLDVGSTPSTPGQVYGRQWNNAGVLPKQASGRPGNF